MWRTVLRPLTLVYISQYPPPDIGNSFCLVVRIFGSEPKGPRFYPAAIFCYIHQMAERQLLQQRISPNSKPMTHFTAQSLHVPAHHQSGQQSAHMHAAHRFLDIQIISNKLGVAPVVHRAAPSYSGVY
ncbi:hypothetical protein AVEN_223687-1 [Araneus ventricosus]|uniref:Uncharacterized protein n=1 Tax=Araneus ventricosus TaxID=182803 RepID=A0A4Y2RU19_ARAVE|nr:hypothetical protein AVEN_223687-1 [Araneus ventricosus]